MRKYWAADSVDKLVSYLIGQIRRTSESSGGYSTLYDITVKAGIRNMMSYYSPIMTSTDTYTSLGFSGDKGELVLMKVPLARTYVRQFVSLVTKDRLSFEALVDVKDQNPIDTAKLGKALANHMVEKNRLDDLRVNATEKAAVTGNAFYSVIWDPDAGEEYDADEEGNIIKTGENVFNVHPLWEVTYDFNVDFNNLKWVCIAFKKNRWDLAAKYPDLESDILNAPDVNQALQLTQANLWRNTQQTTDFIYEYHFFHIPTPAVPQGRHVAFVSEKAVTIDEEYDCNMLPFAPMIIEPLQDSGLGYPMFSSLLPTQEIIDATLSAITSNQLNVSGNIVLLPEGNSISPTQLSKGLKVLPYKPMNVPGGGKPEILSLNSVNSQFFQFAETCIGLLDQLSMINATLRGEPPSNVTSGAMAATLISSSMEFLSSASRANTMALERILTIGIKNYQKYATDAHLIEIVGADNLVRVKNFKSSGLRNINRIKLREQSPVMQTTAGRLAMADALMNKGLADASQYVNLVEGAPVDQIYEKDYDENAAVKREVESFLEGENIVPHILQNHPKFIQEYKRLLDNTPVAMRQQLTEQILTLIEEHLTLEQNLQANPLLFSMLRPGEMPQGGMPQGGMPQGGMQQGAPPPEQAGFGPQDVLQQELPTSEPASPAEPLVGPEVI